MAEYILLGRGNRAIAIFDERSLHRMTQREFKALYAGNNITFELFDILDKAGNKTGRIKPRDLVHQEGDLHGAFHLNVYSIADDVPYMLLQKRASDKDLGAGLYDVLVGGHYAVGETIIDGVREAKEEVALDVPLNDIVAATLNPLSQSGNILYLGKMHDRHADLSKGVTNNELRDIFLYREDQPLSSYTLQEEELDGIVRVPVRSLISLLDGSLNELVSVEGYFLEQGLPSKKEVIIRADDVWDANKDYILKTAHILTRHLAGIAIPEKPYEYSVDDLRLIK